MIKVLIAEDSAIAAALIAKILRADSDLDVVGIAKSGKEALEMTMRLKPDVITMDIHMPIMNGFEATKEIMIQQPTPIVIVSASTAVSETEWAMKALQSGALTLLMKPPGPGAPGYLQSAKELLETVKSMSEVKVVRHHRRRTTPSLVSADTPAPVAAGYRAVAIAASTGGPPALQLLLGALPAEFPTPILLVQHIPSSFVTGFAEWLNSNVELSVSVARDGVQLQPGNVYVGPEDRHLGISRHGRIRLSDDPSIDGFRPSATYLFDSVAQAFESESLAVILTGMGRDGVEGLRTVRAKAGKTIAQDEKTCVVYGMPGVAVEQGLADVVAPIDEIAAVIHGLVAGKKS